MTKSEVALQRRIGRISMLVDILSKDAKPEHRELIAQLRNEVQLLKEVSTRFTESAVPPPRESEENGERIH